MKQVVIVRARDGKTFSIFTQHIAYIEQTAQGCVIHVSCGGENVAIATSMSWPLIVNTFGLPNQ